MKPAIIVLGVLGLVVGAFQIGLYHGKDSCPPVSDSSVVDKKLRTDAFNNSYVTTKEGFIDQVHGMTIQEAIDDCVALRKANPKDFAHDKCVPKTP